MAKRAVWTVSKSGSSVTITISNRDTLDKVYVYKSAVYNDSFSLLDSGYQDSFADTDSGSSKYKVKVVPTESDEVIGTSTEIIGTSTELIYGEGDAIISTSKFTK